MKILIKKGGIIEYIYEDSLHNMLKLAGKITRASHVEPNEKGEWTADMAPSNGPVLGPFATRTKALAAEVAWLERSMMHGAKNS